MFFGSVILVYLLMFSSLSTENDNIRYMNIENDNQDIIFANNLGRKSHVTSTPSEEYGNGTNCDPKNPKAEFHWSPFVVDRSDAITIWLENFVLPVSVDHGSARIELWVPERTDSPILAVTYPFTCSEYVPPPLKCPLQKGLPFPNKPYVFPDIINWPPANFKLKLLVTNERKEIVLCFELLLHVKDIEW